MTRTIINNLADFVDKEVYIKGFLHKKREVSTKLAFVILRDRSGLVQIVLEDEVQIKSLKGLQNGSIIYAEGLVKAEPRASGGVEMHQAKLDIINPVTEVPAIEVDKEINHNPDNYDTLFNNRVLNLRNPVEGGIFKVRDTLVNSVREYFKKNEFTEIDTPKLIAGATEGGAEVFYLDYFGSPACLAQSPQFYKQMLVGAFERVFEIGHAYRAEQSFTTRHLTESLMIDMEMGFVDSFDDVLSMTEGLVKFVCNKTWEVNEKELAALKAEKPLLSETFPRVTLSDLHQLYFDNTGIDLREDKDCAPEEERWICEYSKEKWGSEAVFVTEFPSSDMKFYQKKMSGKEEVTERADLIFRGIELATIPLREHDYDKLVEQIIEHGFDPESEGFKYYVAAFRHGLPPHGGFGMGADRFVKQLVGLASVKEAVMFPRDVNRITP